MRSISPPCEQLVIEGVALQDQDQEVKSVFEGDVDVNVNHRPTLGANMFGMPKTPSIDHDEEDHTTIDQTNISSRKKQLKNLLADAKMRLKGLKSKTLETFEIYCLRGERRILNTYYSARKKWRMKNTQKKGKILVSPTIIPSTPEHLMDSWNRDPVRTVSNTTYSVDDVSQFLVKAMVSLLANSVPQLNHSNDL